MAVDPKIEEAYARIGSYACMLEPDKGIDRSHGKRVVPMEVLSLGMSRTGTLSMQRAFDLLGFAAPYHFSSMFGNIKDADMWLPSLHAKEKQLAYISRVWGEDTLATPERLDEASSVALTDAERGALSKGHFDALLGHVAAVTDTPSINFHYELINYYPEAKVVLVERDFDKWLKSLHFLIAANRGLAPLIFQWLDPTWYGRILAVGGGLYRYLFRQAGAAPTDYLALKAYKRHYEEVRRETPKDRLLEFKLDSGWEPLCKFLGKDVPDKDIPFPKMNEADSFPLVFSAMRARSMKNIAINVGLLTAIVAASVGLWQKYRHP